jgi:hypothetical protein
VNIFYNYSDMAMPLYDIIRKGVVVDKACVGPSDTWEIHPGNQGRVDQRNWRHIGTAKCRGEVAASILLLKLFEQRGKGLLSHRVGV